MQAGGFTETIWHFIGYLHITDSVARTQELYQGDPPPQPQPESYDLPREPLRGIEFDELASVPTRLSQVTPPDPGSSHMFVSPPSSLGVPTKVLPTPPTPLKPLPPAFEDFGIYGGFRLTTREITVEYGDAKGEGLFDIKQINVASDRDLITSDAITYPDGSLVVPPELHLEGEFATLVAQANDIAPDGVPDMMTALQLGTDDVIAMVSARDTLWAETGSPNPDGSPAEAAPVGRIVDGVAGAPDPYVPTVLDSAPWSADTPVVVTSGTGTVTHEVIGPTGGVATLVDAGLNTQTNACLIVDLNEGVGSMMVGGDYFYSRGIVQANILVDNDHVDIAISGALDPIVKTQGNEAHNIAEFITHESTIEVRGAGATPHWVVDVLNGDFYDVKSIVQFNGLNDSDRTVQAENGTYYDLGTGSNGQLNLAKIYSLSDYDIIIIGGNYHRADWIFQYNIILDPDSVKLYSTGGDDSSTTVTTGLNSLTNKATIETYDASGFKPMQDAHHELLGQLAGGATTLTPDADWHLYGSASGTLKILYVTGDYYDANVITQVNFLIDGDQSIQASANGGTEQGVAAGGNAALNEAYIVDPGLLSTSNYLAGQAYEDSMLIQVNIVTDSDKVTIHDTTTLVPELVAFAEHAAPEPQPDCPSTPVPDPAQHDHLTSNILV